MSARLQRNGETILLTGATGYVGSVVAQKLLGAGYSVRGLTRSQDKAPILQSRGLKPIVGDIADPDLMARAAAGVSAIVHTAAPNAPVPGENMDQMIAGVARAARSLADLAAAGNTRLVITGGASIYGPTGGNIVDESTPFHAPSFAAPLADAETELAEAGRAHILRLGVVYGRDQSLPMRTLIENVRKRGATAIVDPAHRLSVVHVDDLANLYLAILEAETPPTIVNGVSAIAPWPEVMHAIGKAAGVSGKPDMITPEEAFALGGPAIYLPIDMAVSGKLARERLAWQPTAKSFTDDVAVKT